MRDDLERFGRAAPQAVRRHHVTAPDESQKRRQRGVRGRDRDVDLPALHQVAVALAVDQSDDAARAHALGEQRAHDVVLVVVGQRQEQIDVVHSLLLQQVLVGAVAVQDQHVGRQLMRQEFGAPLVRFDDLDVETLAGIQTVAGVERAGHSQAYVAAAGDHHAPHRLVHPAQLAHHGADVLRVGEEEDLVARVHHRVAVDPYARVLAKNGDDARVDIRQVTAQLLHRVRDERTAGESAYRDQARPAVGEFEHLQRLRKLDQPQYVVGDRLLGEDDVGSAESLVADQLRVLLQLDIADASDPRRHVEQVGGDLARDQIRLVVPSHCDQDVRVARTRPLQHRRQCRVADQTAQIETVLQLGDVDGIGIDHRDVVRLGHQAFGHRGADPAGADDDDLHGCGSRATG